ncbi:SH3 domain-containing protein (plasmid) [Bacillus mycoides]|nr:SH3 domain-containing protein [Bacillus mycoides]
MKKIIGITTGAVFGIGIFTSSAHADTVVTANVLNVRENPTTESQVVGKLLDGYKLDVINTANGWSQIKFKGKDVFVSSEFTKSMYYVTVNKLNVRAAANTDSGILGTLKEGEMIETKNQVQNNWIEFDYHGKTAYVYFPLITGTAPALKKQKTPPVAKANMLAQPKVEKPAPVKEKEVTQPKVEKPAPAKEEEVTQPKIEKPAPAKEEEVTQPKVEKPAPAKEKEVTQPKVEKPAPAKEEVETTTSSFDRELTVTATAYTADPKENGGTYDGRVLTKSGYDISHTNTYQGMRILATDPKVIPTGSIVTVKIPNQPAFKAIALDTGGAIKNNRIDILVGSNSDADKWGSKSAKVKVLQ